jgi:hypothetical protein
MCQCFRQSYAAATFLAAGLICLSGCTTEPPLPPLFPVKGKVTVDKEAVKGGQVQLVADKPDPEGKTPPSSGQINESGEYEIFTGGKAGAPKGKYKVGVSPPMMPMEGSKAAPKAPYNEKYRTPLNSGLTIDVTESAKEGAYDLKLTK